MKINFYIRPETKIVHLFISLYGERKPIFNTELKPGKNWDKKKQRIKEGVTGAAAVNDKLKGFIDRVRDRYDELCRNGTRPSFELLKKVFEVKEVEPEPEKITFLSFMHDQIEYQYKEGFTKRATWKHEKTSHGWLTKFKRIDFDNIDDELYKKLLVFLSKPIKNDDGTEKRLMNNSIGTVIKHLKKYCKLASKKRLLLSLDYQDFKKPSEKIFKITYTEADILKVYKIKFLHQRMQEAVDLNTFKFYAGGMRHGDSQLIVGLENVVDVKLKDGSICKALYFSQDKTEKGNVVLLNDINLEILKKYNYRLPKISSSECNKHLKQAFRIAGFKRPVTVIRHSNKERIEKTVPEWEILGKSHTARYSAARMIVEKTGDLYLAKEILGHKKISTTEGYVQTSESFKHEGYNKVING